MANQYVNKVIYGNDTLVDLTSDTVSASTVLAGYTAHDKSGAPIVGVAVAGGYTVSFATTNPDLYGATITIKQGSTVIGTVAFDNTGSASYTVENPGTYSWSVTLSGETYTDTFTVAAQEVDIETTFVYRDWLIAGELNPSDYASLAAVLADETAVRKLMTIHASVDYLASFASDDTSVVTILNNDYAAKWITRRAYAEDTLTAAYGTLMGTIGKYGYGKWSLMPQVPKMTSNTAPYGEAVKDSENSSYYAYKALNRDASDYWQSNTSNTGGGQYIGYKFTNPVCVRRFKQSVGESGVTISTKLQYSDNGTTWTDAETTTFEPFETKVVEVADHGHHLYWRNLVTSASGGSQRFRTYELQFYAYAPEGNVPVMTSNSAPYGEASASSEYSATYAAYKAFDGDESTRWASVTSGTTGYLTYKFTNPVCAKRVRVYNGATQAVTYTITGSNDGSTWSTPLITHEKGSGEEDITLELNNDVYYLYYRYNYTVVSPGDTLFTLQFYGRELKVSVPAMTSNTTPYGEVEATSYYNNDSGYAPWRAFDNANSNGWLVGPGDSVRRLVYHFTQKTLISFVMLDTTKYGGNTNIKLQVSDDGVDYTDLQTVATTKNRVFTELTSPQNKEYFAIVVETYNPSDRGIHAQFYGKDYSEYDWDTEHPRHYIYDSGVELEELEQVNATNGWSLRGYTFDSLAVKNPCNIYLPPTSANHGNGIGMKNGIDVSPFDLIRAKLCVNNADGTSVTVPYSKAMDQTTHPYVVPTIGDTECSLDISNVNQMAYPNITGCFYATVSTYLTEMWLE